ncbi:MAG: T9SS type A sorting domain-containing protein, partial [Bacteroidales bacterium]|nr:T9SS type A sorting domain-containing protein [Bacteroidales bacterium]MCF8391098.1 T9SS type A sorting domain-containing protein [Bacteroidales bacterium]
DGTNGLEIWTYDGTTASMLKDINQKVGAGDSKPAGFKEVDGLLFFVADDSTGVKLWVTDGTAEHTMSVANALNSTFAPVAVDYKEFAVIGSVLYYTADDANGFDNFYSVDAKYLFPNNVTFTITDANGVVENASVEFDGATYTTDANGMVTFEYVRNGADLAYKVSKEAYIETTGMLTVDNADVSEDVLITLIPLYSVTFTITDGTNPLTAAAVTFNGATVNTDASGVAVFSDLEAATGLAYTVSLAGYIDATGSIDVVDADVNKAVTLALITYSVTFNISNGSSAIAGASITFNGSTMTSDASGVAVFTNVVPATGLAYTVSLAGYSDASGSIDVIDADLNKAVTLTLLTYSVTFNVSDASGVVADASITFNGSTLTSDAGGVAVFTDVVPATGMAYSVTLANYIDETGTVDVDGDEVVNITLLPTAVFNHMIQGVNVYPNPSNGEINIAGLSVGSKYEVYSVNQSLVKSGLMESTTMKLNLEQGLYILKVKSEGKTYYSKIVIK